jgi:CRISPR/Cas system CMR-associated protein Cmr3 (group 5 of RAMP superfamily)
MRTFKVGVSVIKNGIGEIEERIYDGDFMMVTADGMLMIQSEDQGQDDVVPDKKLYHPKAIFAMGHWTSCIEQVSKDRVN